jgi:MoaA/NifB/PqqE/SkfB family radical SAM enzyme
MKVCWNITNRCNEHCEYCFRELLQEPRSLEDNKKIVDNLVQLGVTSITFAGGEPLMYPYLLDLIKYANGYDLKINLITNGSLLKVNSVNCLKILQYLNKITFSLDSTNNAINENLGRGINHFEHLKKIIPIVHEVLPDLNIEINSVVTKKYPNETNYLIDEIQNNLLYHGVKKLKVSRFDPIRGNAYLLRDEFDLSDERFESIKTSTSRDDIAFTLEYRDKEDIEKNYIVTPNGSLSKAVNSKDIIIVDNLAKDIDTIRKDINANDEMVEEKGKVRKYV